MIYDYIWRNDRDLNKLPKYQRNNLLMSINKKRYIKLTDFIAITYIEKKYNTSNTISKYINI